MLILPFKLLCGRSINCNAVMLQWYTYLRVQYTFHKEYYTSNVLCWYYLTLTWKYSYPQVNSSINFIYVPLLLCADLASTILARSQVSLLKHLMKSSAFVDCAWLHINRAVGLPSRHMYSQNSLVVHQWILSARRTVSPSPHNFTWSTDFAERIFNRELSN